jgi:hypothetical protein
VYSSEGAAPKKKRKQGLLTLTAEKLLDKKKGVAKLSSDFPRMMESGVFSEEKHSEVCSHSLFQNPATKCHFNLRPLIFSSHEISCTPCL